MRKILLLLTSILWLSSFGQKKDKSGSFEEPMGWCKLVQLNNGNTCFLEFTKKEGIKSVLYDTIRKKIAGSSGKLPTKMIEDKLGYYILSGVYEINGDVAIFFQKAEDRTPIMIRIIVDGKTGKLKSEEKIAELEKISRGDVYAIAFGGVGVPDFKIVKDPDSDYYAMIVFNPLAAETKDRIEVIHFSPDHKVINKSKYTDPNSKFKYTKYLNAYVNKDEYVVIGTLAFNTSKSGGEESKFYISSLSKGKTTFTQKEIPIDIYTKTANFEFVPNPAKKLVHMIILIGSEAALVNFKPSTLTLEKPYSPDFSKINDYFTSTMGNKEDFKGAIQGAFVDKTGNLVLMLQETSIKVDKFGTVSATILGDVALIKISAEGKTINSSVFPFKSFVSGDHSYFCSNQIKTGFKPANNFDDKGLASDQYLAIDFVSTENASYILCNNYPKNMEVEKSKDVKMIKAIGASTAVKYTYKNDALKGDYLLKKPKEKNDVEFCLFGASSYNPAKKTYATIFTDPEK